jgi:chlorophyll synthase
MQSRPIRAFELFEDFCTTSVLTHSLILALRPLFYSLVGIGAGICNDFKSMEGDKKFGLQSIPLMVGIDTAKILAALIPDMVQLGVAGFWYQVGEPLTAAIVAACLLPQIYFQSTLLWKDPLGNDQKYVAVTQPFVVFGILASSLTMGHHDWAGFLP